MTTGARRRVCDKDDKQRALLEAAAQVFAEAGYAAAAMKEIAGRADCSAVGRTRLFRKPDHPVVGRHHVLAIPFRYGSVDKWYRSAAPTWGQHNASILGDLLGLDAAPIAVPTDQGVIGTRPGGLD
ncbi:TetR family transcriptional regulator [Mycobacterium bourgelatii]|uniref:TetR family transcriptional regulator n=1 Tax=Mycobacterium bourgelatii TaxID=1273442 RepID=UPI001F071FE7|nr:TetR family transcriptional regulator [Mycobacterium bourgelatii]